MRELTTYPTETIDQLAVHVGSGATPRGGAEVYLTAGVLFVRSQNVRFKGLDLADVAFIDTRTHEAMSRSQVFAHDVLLNITGASIGRCCVLPTGLGDANVNQHVCAIRLPNPNHADAAFLNAVLASHIGQHQIEILNAGGNREGLNYQQLRSFVVPWPDAGIRGVVSEILDTLDEAIRKTEEIIAKLKQVKQGLLHDLLTRGIDDNGELRDPIRHPEQFKDSPLGRIPKVWEVGPLGRHATLASGTTPSRGVARYWSVGTIPWVKTGEVTFSEIVDTDEHVTEAALRDTGLRLFPSGTVLVAMYGQGTTRGKVGILGTSATTNQACAAIAGSSGINQRFLFHYLSASYARMRSLGHGSHQTNLSATLLAAMKVTVPSLNEQAKLVDGLDSLDARSAAEAVRVSKLRLLKNGLMEDLLTGRVRVTGLLERAVE